MTINNLFPSECSYVCTANPIWCSFTDIRISILISLAVIFLFTLVHIITGLKKNYSFAGTECGIDWAHYLFVYPVMMIMMFALSLVLTLLFGVALRWII